MKKLLILAMMSLLVLAACGDDEDSDNAPSTQAFEADLYEVRYPRGWQVEHRENNGGSVTAFSPAEIDFSALDMEDSFDFSEVDLADYTEFIDALESAPVLLIIAGPDDVIFTDGDGDPNAALELYTSAIVGENEFEEIDISEDDVERNEIEVSNWDGEEVVVSKVELEGIFNEAIDQLEGDYGFYALFIEEGPTGLVVLASAPEDQFDRQLQSFKAIVQSIRFKE